MAEGQVHQGLLERDAKIAEANEAATEELDEMNLRREEIASSGGLGVLDRMPVEGATRVGVDDGGSNERPKTASKKSGPKPAQ